jgi:hypothetical protein
MPIGHPEPPAGQNPSRQDWGTFASYVVCLPCPEEINDEISGEWDGPIYARLLRAQWLQTDERSVFMEEDPPHRRPGYIARLVFAFDDNPLSMHQDRRPVARTEYAVPLWRLHQPFANLRGEMGERPLLLLYRFVRTKLYFVKSDTNPKLFLLTTSPHYLCGQVIEYRAKGDCVLMDNGGLTVFNNNCTYWCTVSIRCLASEPVLNVVIPSDWAHRGLISREEFVVGWCHGLPAELHPNRRLPRF